VAFWVLIGIFSADVSYVLIVVSVLLALGVGATLLLHKFVAPPGARTVIVFAAGRASVKRGNVAGQTLRFVEDVLRQTGAKRASVGVLPNGSLWFSPSIPAAVYQQLRNLLIR